jgi:hypothetical protein
VGAVRRSWWPDRDRRHEFDEPPTAPPPPPPVVGLTVPPPIDHGDGTLPLVFWFTIRCFKCRSTKTRCTGRHKGTRGMTYHRCQECGVKFRALELGAREEPGPRR